MTYFLLLWLLHGSQNKCLVFLHEVTYFGFWCTGQVTSRRAIKSTLALDIWRSIQPQKCDKERVQREIKRVLPGLWCRIALGCQSRDVRTDRDSPGPSGECQPSQYCLWLSIRKGDTAHFLASPTHSSGETRQVPATPGCGFNSPLGVLQGPSKVNEVHTKGEGLSQSLRWMTREEF